MVLLYAGILVSGSAQSLLNVGIGPTWPKDLRETEKPTAWNVTIEYGKIFDNIIGIGVDIDFSWNRFSTDSAVISTSIPPDTVYKELEDNKFFMFPISVFLLIDPISKFKVHPVIKGQVGFNMAIRSYKEVTPDNEINESKKNGFYWGIIGKASADCVFDLGEHAAIFAGFEFQWGRLRHNRRDKSTDIEYKDYFEFYGPGIRMGFSFLF